QAFGGLPRSLKASVMNAWHREGRLHPGHQFSWSWARGGETAGDITVRVASDAVVLIIEPAVADRPTGNLSSSECRSGLRPATSVVRSLIRLSGLLQRPPLRGPVRHPLLRWRAARCTVDDR